MTRHRVRRIGTSLLAVLALATATAPASGHPYDSAYPQPTSFAGAVHLIRDELHVINQSRESGRLADAVASASRLATLANAVPGFALTLSGALQDSAAGRILRTSERLGATAGELRRAADRGDLAGIAVQVSRCADLASILDAYVPARYVCPMHCETGRVYERAGLCPTCGMHLQRITEDRYSVDVRAVNGPLRAGVPATLDLQVVDPDGFEVRNLQVVHEKLLHRMIVSQDLSWFAHEHPVPGPNGRFRLRYTFPAGGTYVLFHDFTPDSVGMQVVPVELAVQGPERPPEPLVVDDDRPRRVDGCDVTLAHTRLAAGIPCSMVFTLTRNGRPVTDLEPYLGVAGHLVMISQDRAVYLHSHPLAPEPVRGPGVEFTMTFARTGLYKAWGQFRRHGRVLTVPFVVEVAGEGGPADRLGAASGDAR